jgi:hypothetical protein
LTCVRREGPSDHPERMDDVRRKRKKPARRDVGNVNGAMREGATAAAVRSASAADDSAKRLCGHGHAGVARSASSRQQAGAVCLRRERAGVDRWGADTDADRETRKSTSLTSTTHLT